MKALISFAWKPYQNKSEEKLEESQEIAREAAIAAGTHVNPLRGKG